MKKSIINITVKVPDYFFDDLKTGTSVDDFVDILACNLSELPVFSRKPKGTLRFITTDGCRYQVVVHGASVATDTMVSAIDAEIDRLCSELMFS